MRDNIIRIKNDLNDALKVRVGNYRRSGDDDYARGYANGLILAMSIITGEEPRFFKKSDIKSSMETIKNKKF